MGPEQGRYPNGVARAVPRSVDPKAAFDRPFGINLFGPFDAISGLGTAARNLRDAVAACDIPFDLRPIDVETGHVRITAQEAARPLRFRINLVLANADQIRALARLYPDRLLDNSYTIAVWAWELAAFRPDWHAAFALVDEVWTNSRFELRAIAACAPVPVHLVPLPVPPSAAPDELGTLRALGRARFGLDPKAFVFLCPFDGGSTEARKNPLAAIGAFHDAFRRDPTTLLVVKCHSADPALLARLAASIGDLANVVTIDRRLDADEMRLLQAASDALISPHRAEGFGLNLAEFLAVGKAVVATDYSGSADFLDAGNGFSVASRLTEVGRRSGPYLAHSVWADPDHEAFCDALRAARRAGRDPDRERRIAHDMERRFGIDAIGRRIAGRLRTLGLETSIPDHAGSSAATSLDRFTVGAEDGHDEIVWPARLPTLSIVLDAARDDLPDLLGLLDAQIYPFWEAICAGEGLPPPEAFAARAGLRGSRLRVRLVECEGGDPIGRAVEGSSGAWLVFPGQAASPAPDALLRIASHLDRDDPDDRFELPPASGGLRIVRKTVFLARDGEDADRSRPDTRAWLAGVLPPGVRIGPAGRRRLDLPTLAGETSRSAEIVALSEPARMSASDLASLLVGLGAGRVRGILLGPDPALEPDKGLVFVAMPEPEPAPPVAVDRPIEVHARPCPLPAAAHIEAVRSSGLLDERHYLVHAPDVAAAGIDPVAHYCDYGWREHRAPNFYFDPVYYRARYMASDPDEALDPLLHWIAYRHSGVRPSRLFDPAWVRRAQSLRRDADPLRAYLAVRNTENVSPLVEFDAAFYRARRRDIAYLKVDPFEHYMRFGAREGLNPSAEFDTRYYAGRHMRDVASHDPVASNPLLHFLERRDHQPVLTSRVAALRQQISRLHLLGLRVLDLGFCWHDGLPQQIEFLRTFLSEPSLAIAFRVVFANESLAASVTDPRLLAALRLPYEDPYDDADIADRLAECFADPRCLRVEGRPVLGMMCGDRADAVARFLGRIAVSMRRDHAITPALVRID